MNRHRTSSNRNSHASGYTEMVPQIADNNISHFDSSKNAKASKTLLLITSRNKYRSSHPSAHQHKHHLL
ncbi:hypothetical protein T11_7144 [Trichinella zimbabwensis]|uniref:Uncharacterized protein n=1 Tax=Trichinella zimbabwensis TaxID=268475 RepID=A0A0V1H0S0_9BILA|nr:hypothetical protein T11_7144 [Trichinella zimbabwensis]